MQIVFEKKFLEKVWWKYGLGLGAAQIFGWVMLGYVLQGKIDIVDDFTRGQMVWTGWLVFSMMPFAMGRLGLRRMFWCGIIGFALGDLAYVLLAFFTPIRVMIGGLLPFIAFSQINVGFLTFGGIIEFGRYVYRRVFEE